MKRCLSCQSKDRNRRRFSSSGFRWDYNFGNYLNRGKIPYWTTSIEADNGILVNIIAFPDSLEEFDYMLGPGGADAWSIHYKVDREATYAGGYEHLAPASVKVSGTANAGDVKELWRIARPVIEKQIEDQMERRGWLGGRSGYIPEAAEIAEIIERFYVHKGKNNKNWGDPTNWNRIVTLAEEVTELVNNLKGKDFQFYKNKIKDGWRKIDRLGSPDTWDEDKWNDAWWGMDDIFQGAQSANSRMYRDYFPLSRNAQRRFAKNIYAVKISLEDWEEQDWYHIWKEDGIEGLIEEGESAAVMVYVDLPNMTKREIDKNDEYRTNHGYVVISYDLNEDGSLSNPGFYYDGEGEGGAFFNMVQYDHINVDQRKVPKRFKSIEEFVNGGAMKAAKALFGI